MRILSSERIHWIGRTGTDTQEGYNTRVFFWTVLGPSRRYLGFFLVRSLLACPPPHAHHNPRPSPPVEAFVALGGNTDGSGELSPGQAAKGGGNGPWRGRTSCSALWDGRPRFVGRLYLTVVCGFGRYSSVQPRTVEFCTKEIIKEYHVIIFVLQWLGVSP